MMGPSSSRAWSRDGGGLGGGRERWRQGPPPPCRRALVSPFEYKYLMKLPIFCGETSAQIRLSVIIAAEANCKG